MILRQTKPKHIRFLYLLAISVFSCAFSGLKGADSDLVVGDLTINKNDYTCVMWLDQKPYTGTIPGEKKSVLTALSLDKWYFNCAFFEDDKLVNVRAFPAKLLVKETELDAFKPSYAGFLPRTHTGWRDLVTVEKGQLCLYNVNAEKDATTGSFWASIDFGKRTPIHDNVNSTSIQGDKHGNIYFTANDKKNYMWDSKSETVKPVTKMPARAKNPTYEHSESNGMLVVTIDDKSFTVPLDTSIDIVDPLSIDEKRIKAPYENYGTNGNPISADDYKMLISFYQWAPGQILVCNDLLSRNQNLALDPKLSLSDQEQKELEQTISDMAATYTKKTAVISELKKVIREYGATGMLKKRFSDAEVTALVTALSPENGGGGVIPRFDHKGRAELDEKAQLVIPLGYYRTLKKDRKKGFNKKEFESPDKSTELSNAVAGYPVSIMEHNDNWKTVLNDFMKVPEQASWQDWFEKTGKSYKGYKWTAQDVQFELLFDYLASLSDGDFKKKLTEAGIKHIKQTRFKTLIDIYKSTNLYAGKA